MRVACIAAPSHAHAKPDSPWRSLHGEKWSDDHARSNPAASVSRMAVSSALGAICSCDAWMPTAAMRLGLPVGWRIMPAYVVATVTDARDQDKLVEYRNRNTDVVAAHGGRFIARGGRHEVLEGDYPPLRVVI